MKLETFIEKLDSVGFLQCSKTPNWYENHINNTSVFVGIMGSEIDSLGHIIIEVVTSEDGSDEDVEKDFITTTGAWKAINKIINNN